MLVSPLSYSLASLQEKSYFSNTSPSQKSLYVRLSLSKKKWPVFHCRRDGGREAGEGEWLLESQGQGWKGGRGFLGRGVPQVPSESRLMSHRVMSHHSDPLQQITAPS